MAYNPYTAVQKVYNAKVAYGNATTDEERKRQQEIANSARAELARYGYSDLANSISAQGADADAVKRVMGTYAKTAKTATRPYLYSLGQAYGLSTAEIDNIIGWDNDTGELSIGGKKIGKPDAVYDGVSYWGDTSVLDSAFSEYADRSGLTRSKESAVNQENEKLFKLYSQEYEDLKKTNPFATEEAKAILAKYDMSGLNARDSATASGAGSNGGNIDSFAAANAMRQQAALVNQGQMAVLEAHNQKLDRAQRLLESMGVNIDRVYNQDETSKNNAVSRDVAISESTGYSTDNQLKASSSLWGSDGSLADTNTDYQSRINEVEALYNSAQNDSDKQSYALALKLLEMARNDKIDQTGRTEGKTYKYQNLVDNANTRLTKEQIAQADRVLFAEQTEGQKDRDHEINKIVTAAALGADVDGQKKTMTGEQAMSALKNGEISQTIIDAYNTAYGRSYTLANPPPVYKKPEGGEEGDGEVEVVRFDGPIDMSKVLSVGLDANGRNMVTALINEAAAKGGVLTVDEVTEFVINNSDKYDTNVNQLKKVYAYLGIDQSVISDAAKNNSWWDWKAGVTPK